MTRSTCANESCCFCAPVGEAQESRPSQSACSACRLRRGEPPSECNDLSLVDHLEQPPRTLPHVSDLTACQAHLQRGTVAADARARCQICPPWHGDLLSILELPLPDHLEARSQVGLRQLSQALHDVGRESLDAHLSPQLSALALLGCEGDAVVDGEHALTRRPRGDEEVAGVGSAVP